MMFFVNDNNRGETLTKDQRAYIGGTVANALTRCECAGDLLKAIDALFNVYKEANDGKQSERLKIEEEEEARANKFGVIIVNQYKAEVFKICNTFNSALAIVSDIKKDYKNVNGVSGFEIDLYGGNGCAKETVYKYYYPHKRG